MATLKSGLNSGSGFSNSDTVTSTTLNNHVNDGGIVAGTIATADLADSSSKTTGVTFAKMQHISTAKVLGNVSGSEGDVSEVSFLDEDTLSSNSATAVASQQSIKAYVDNNALKETILVFRENTPITIADWDSGVNGTQCTLEFDHLRDSAQSDPDTAATDINDASVSLSSNEFTLTEGTYDIEVNATITMNTSSGAVPGLSVIGFIKRKSDDQKMIISNVLNHSDNVALNMTLASYLKGRIVVPNSPSSNTNVYDLRFVAQNSGSALIGQEAPSEFEGLDVPLAHVSVSIKKIKA